MGVVVLVAQSCPTLCDLTDCSPQARLSMGFSRQEFWSGLPFLSPEDLPNPETEPGSPALQADSLPFEPQGRSRGCKLLCLLGKYLRVDWLTHKVVTVFKFLIN